METKFKTFITESGEYGIIDVDPFSDGLMVGTSSHPTLYSKETTVEDLKSYWNGWYMDSSIIPFEWDIHIPKDWKLVEIEVKIV